MENIGNMLFKELERKFKTSTIPPTTEIFYDSIDDEIMYFISDSVNSIIYSLYTHLFSNYQYKTLALTYNKNIVINPIDQYNVYIPTGENGRNDIYIYIYIVFLNLYRIQVF